MHRKAAPTPRVRRASPQTWKLQLYVAGQTLGGAVVRIEPGQWVELRNQQHGRIVVRLDRIDGVAMP